MATDQEVEAERAKVDSLRDQLADEQAAAEDRARDRENDVTMAALQEEENALKAQIEAAQAANVVAPDAPLLTAEEPPAPPPPPTPPPSSGADDNDGGGF